MYGVRLRCRHGSSAHVAPFSRNATVAGARCRLTHLLGLNHLAILELHYPTNSVPTLAQERPPGTARVGERPLGSHRSRYRDRDALAEDTACREGRFTSSESLPCRLPLHLCRLHDDARRMPSRMRPVLVR